METCAASFPASHGRERTKTMPDKKKPPLPSTEQPLHQVELMSHHACESTLGLKAKSFIIRLKEIFLPRLQHKSRINNAMLTGEKHEGEGVPTSGHRVDHLDLGLGQTGADVVDADHGPDLGLLSPGACLPAVPGGGRERERRQSGTCWRRTCWCHLLTTYACL